MSKAPIVDRAFAEKFLQAADRPFDYHVYFLFHDFWAEAPQKTIDAYMSELMSTEGVDDFLAERHLAEQIDLDDLADCAPGTLGHGYRNFILDNDLEANLARNYREFNAKLSAEGALDRLPDDLSYTIVRGFQIHDYLHILTGFSPSPEGELAQAAFHYAQLRFPYHALRVAVTTAHIAFAKPDQIIPAMDAMSAGWAMGRAAKNLHFMKWEGEFDTPIAKLRADVTIDTSRYESF